MLYEPWRLQLLGGLRLHQQHTVIEHFRTRKAAALLAYLALYAHRQHAREDLAELFWPDIKYTLQSKLHNLSEALSTLRRYLEPTPSDKGTVLRSTHTYITLNREAIVVDTSEFETALGDAERATDQCLRGKHLTRAVAIYTGDLLPGNYEEWALQERERFNLLFVQTLQQLAEYVGNEGHTQQAIDHALLATHKDPYNDAVYFTLIRWLMASGQSQRALTCYREFESRLQKELHTVPSAALRSLLQQSDSEKLTTVFPLASVSGQIRAEDATATVFPAILASHTAGKPLIPLVHLPLTMTAFFGRDAEMGQANLILGSARLLTITGLGGSGKTRLAIEIGCRQAENNRFDIIVFVALADIAHESDLLPTILSTLSTVFRQSDSASARQNYSPVDALAQIGTLLAARRALLILDNFEHLTESAHVLLSLLQTCPQLSCLITSRSPLQLSGERLLILSPFPCPHNGLMTSELQAHPVICLFVDRAQAARSNFKLTSQNAHVLAGLCADLDGLPLALELAAARIGTFTLSEMRRQLANGKERFQLLVARHRDTHHRHHSLTAALGWSYCQLLPAYQHFFARLSILQGEWTVEAAHAVGGFANKHDSLQALEHLSLASLLISITEEGEPGEPAEARFHLLETLRQFGQQQLSLQEVREAAHRHALFFLDLAESTAYGSGQKTENIWFARMESVHSNLRAALDWCFGMDGDNIIGLRLCTALTQFWFHRCHFAEALRYFNTALTSEADSNDDALRADVLYGAALFAGRLNHYKKATQWACASLELLREQEKPLKTAKCLQNLAHFVWCLHDLEASEAYHHEALTLYERLEEADGIVYAYCGLGEIASNRGDMKNAALWQARSLTVARQSGNHYLIGVALNKLSDQAAAQEQWSRAKAFSIEALTILQTRQDEYQIAYTYKRIANACCGLAEWKEAEAYLLKAFAILERLNDRSGLAGAYNHRAELAWKQNRLGAARAHLQQCFSLLLQTNEPLSVAKLAENWIVLTFDFHEFSRLLALLSTLNSYLAAYPTRRLPIEQRNYETCLNRVRVHIGPVAYEIAWQQGQALSWQEILGQILML